MSDSRVEPEVRFWSRVDKTETCWLWTGPVNRQGYGQFSYSKSKTIRAHKFAYEQTVGPVPEGLTLDHVWPRCTHKNCVRPDHLEPVTRGDNVRRWAATITHCPQGHSYAEHGVTRQHPKGWTFRVCRRMRTGQNADQEIPVRGLRLRRAQQQPEPSQEGEAQWLIPGWPS